MAFLTISNEQLAMSNEQLALRVAFSSPSETLTRTRRYAVFMRSALYGTLRCFHALRAVRQSPIVTQTAFLGGWSGPIPYSPRPYSLTHCRIAAVISHANSRIYLSLNWVPVLGYFTRKTNFLTNTFQHRLLAILHQAVMTHHQSACFFLSRAFT